MLLRILSWIICFTPNRLTLPKFKLFCFYGEDVKKDLFFAIYNFKSYINHDRQCKKRNRKSVGDNLPYSSSIREFERKSSS